MFPFLLLDQINDYEAGIAQSVKRRAMRWTAGVRFPAGARDFSLLHNVQTVSGDHALSYAMRVGGFFLGSKAAEARSWPLSSV
jgi:hypothetical protein